jgi:flavodoxin
MENVKLSILLIVVFLLLPWSAFASDTLILYYSRTGTNKTIAEHVQAQIPQAPLVEITTSDDRSGILGFITCLWDQWFDKDAEIIVPDVNLGESDTIIFCTPIWMQNLSSPIRTFIKQSPLKGKTAYFFVTYGGRLNEEKADAIKKWVADQGLILKGFYGSGVGGKTEEEIKKQVNDHLRDAALLTVTK